MRSLNCIFVIITIILISGCEQETDSTSNLSKPVNYNCIDASQNCDIVPLAVGNTWIYQIINYDTLGNETARFNDTTSIVTDTVIDGETWYTYEQSSEWYTNKIDGFYLFINNKKVMIYKYPVKKGDAFSMREGSNILIESNDTLITTAAGTFSCVTYKIIENSSLETKMYFAPGIGRIFQKVRNLQTKPQLRNQIPDFDLTLISYDLK
jgi:hypothetical protein